MFFTAFVLCILILFKLKTEAQTIFRNPHYKVTILQSKFRFEQQGAGALFSLAKSTYYIGNGLLVLPA